MPKDIPALTGTLQYWFGDKEAKARAWDIRYVKARFPTAEFVEEKDSGHASMATLHSKEMAERFIAIVS